MSITTRIKDAWGAFWGDSSGFVTMAGGAGGVVGAGGSIESYMGISAYFACIRNISEDIAKLPLITYKRLERGKERATTHPYFRLLRRQPHPSIGSIAFRETVTRNAMAWGNGYARIHRYSDGEVYLLEPIYSPLVTLRDAADDGEIEYVINSNGQDDVVKSCDIIHIHGLSLDGVNGLSVASYAKETLDFAGQAQTYGKNLFARGGRPGGLLRTPNKLNPEAKKKLGAAWDAAYSGKDSGKTAVLDNDLDYKQISVSPVDAQYLETRQFTVEEIARWFRMPLHKIQYLVRAQGWSTLDAMNTDYLTDTLMPWLERWEEELTRKLFTDDDEHFVEHLVTGLLRGDQKSRSEFYTKQFSIGALSINEIRELENMNPIEGEGGDKHFVPLNMTPAEFANSITGGKSKDDS